MYMCGQACVRVRVYAHDWYTCVFGGLFVFAHSGVRVYTSAKARASVWCGGHVHVSVHVYVCKCACLWVRVGVHACARSLLGHDFHLVFKRSRVL